MAARGSIRGSWFCQRYDDCFSPGQSLAAQREIPASKAPSPTRGRAPLPIAPAIDMTTTLLTVLFAAAALLVALALAFLPLRLLVFGMARTVRGSIREWVQRRRRDRRVAPRESPERRKTPPPYVEENRRDEDDRRSDDRRRDERRDGEPSQIP